MASKNLNESWTPAELDRFLRLGIEPDHAVRHREAVTAKAHKETSEAVFRGRVVKIAEDAGWLCYWLRDSRDANTSGFPDLVMVRPVKCSSRFAIARNNVLFVELKVGRNQPTGEQCQWLEALEDSYGESFLWTPADLADIERILR